MPAILVQHMHCVNAIIQYELKLIEIRKEMRIINVQLEPVDNTESEK